MSPSPVFDNAPFNFEEMSAAREVGIEVEEHGMASSVHAFFNQMPGETPVQDQALNMMASVIPGDK